MRHRLTLIARRGPLRPLSGLVASALLILFNAAPLAAQVRLVEVGISCPDFREGVIIEAPGTTSGFVRRIQGISFDLPGRSLPAVPGLGFGFRTEVEGDTPVKARMITRHPPMGPDGITEQAYSITLPAGGQTYGRIYRFDYGYELLVGTWTLAVEVEGKTVVSVDFAVTDGPDARVDAACGIRLQS